MKRVSFITLSVLLLVLTFMHGRELVIMVGSSTTYHVYSGQSIQEAISSAQSGDTIFVHAGTYYEHVVVNKTVVIIGENESTTIIDGNGTGNVIEVVANNVKITAFTVQNSGPEPHHSGISLDHSSFNNISYNIIKNNNDGVQFYNSNNNVFAGNNITNNDDGIDFSGGSNNNVLTRNTITSNRDGIHFLGSDNNNNVLTNNYVAHNNGAGLSLSASSNSTITGNFVSDSRVGIWFGGSSNHILTGNEVSDNRIGIDIGASNNNVLTGNNVSSNIEVGIGIAHSSNNVLTGNNVINNGHRPPIDNITMIQGIGIILGACENITIYHNNFVNNAKQAYSSVSTVSWDYGGEGNYWSDYEGKDFDSDGIGDSPYVIPEEDSDGHPLMKPWTPTWRLTPLWMRWWFWIITAIGIVAVLVGAVYFLKKRKPPPTTLTPPPEGTNRYCTRKNVQKRTLFGKDLNPFGY